MKYAHKLLKIVIFVALFHSQNSCDVFTESTKHLPHATLESLSIPLNVIGVSKVVVYGFVISCLLLILNVN